MPSRLKSLELHGYKTFANRTLFEFSEAVTAIVGPNGSGKSNIADSLRWALGEQSYSLLRAKKTEDMIFSGSESRPRAGMASATVAFDNSDGWLPIDFSEVAITRRAYRDGENEYLINGQRVRLKDVMELLAQSGLAERTYTVIGQGLVDATLSLKAEERRRLFEEAAGIGLYRSRKEEALRRLEITQRNLERVQDILAELQPRLASLERQARRAREYDQVKADLQVLLREWYGYHWHNSQKELAHTRQIERSQEAKLERARKEQGDLDGKLTVLRERIQTLRTNLNSWHRQLAQLHTRRETLSRELAVAEERRRALNDQQSNIQLQLASLERESGLSMEQLSALDQEIEVLNLDLDEARTQAIAARNALEQRQVERGEAEEALQVARQEVASHNARQGQLQAQLAECQTRGEGAQHELETTTQELVKVEQLYQASERRLQAEKHAMQDAEKAKTFAEEALLAHQQQVEALESTYRQALEERSKEIAEITRLRTQLNVLEQAEAALSGYASGTRILLEASRSNQLPGVVGAVSGYLEVPAELEMAISAALGEYLDAVVLDTDAGQALDLLDKEAGRGVILPLRDLKPRATFHATINSNVLGVAANLIQASPELRPVIDLLLGQVIIVRDRRTAKAVLENQPHGLRAVTLRGEVFHASGPIHTSGAREQSGEQTLLGRNRLRREAAFRLESSEQQVKQLSEYAEHLEAELKGLQAKSEPLKAALQKAHHQWDERTQIANQARLAMEQAHQQMRWQQEQKEHWQVEITRYETEAASLLSELSHSESQLVDARKLVHETNQKLGTLSLDECQVQVAHWDTRVAVIEQKQIDIQKRHQEQQEAIKRYQHLQSSLQERLDETSISMEELDQEQSSQRIAETELGEEIKEYQNLIEPSEIELDEIDKEHTELLKAETISRQSLSMAEHFYAQARIALDRKQEALQSLRRHIEEDFGLVAFEYTEQVSGPTPLPLEGMVEQLPKVSQLSQEIEEAIRRQRAQLRRMGAINPEAQAEYHEVKQRFGFLTEQVADLHQAERDVHQVIEELDILMEREFRKTFQAVAVEFRQIFTRLFGGGSARLILTDPEEMTTTGIDIEARLPGRRTQGLSLLSGGERSLTATALIFALLKVSPTPFCVLDEVDAMLDEVNVGRYRELLSELSHNTQFVIVTHNRNTVQAADVIYGVTMGRDSVSQVLSLKLDEVGQVVD